MRTFKFEKKEEISSGACFHISVLKRVFKRMNTTYFNNCLSTWVFFVCRLTFDKYVSLINANITGKKAPKHSNFFWSNFTIIRISLIKIVLIFVVVVVVGFIRPFRELKSYFIFSKFILNPLSHVVRYSIDNIYFTVYSIFGWR